MQTQTKSFLLKGGVILAVVPMLIYAHEFGPDAGVAGVPNEAGTCAQSGCHVGTPVNGGGGNVAVNFPSGLTYAPGVKQHLVVTISDANQRRWGFQLTARAASDTTKMGGAFSPTDNRTQLICDVFSDLGIWARDRNDPAACPDSLPLAYIEQTRAGYNVNQSSPATFEFDWTPPATDVGPINIYVAANAANGDVTEKGDHIYTVTYSLTDQPPCPSGPPTISSVTVLQPGFTTMSWVSIQGCNLASGARFWTSADFSGTNTPVQLDDVTVAIDTQPAAIEYISPTQIIAWTTSATLGSVTVTNNQGATAPFTPQSRGSASPLIRKQ
jgi:hypothetical protein